MGKRPAQRRIPFKDGIGLLVFLYLIYFHLLFKFIKMNITPDLQLSSELQELYLENKEWISQLQFLKDEYRFFIKLFDTEQNVARKHSVEQVLMIGDSLLLLRQKIAELEKLTSAHQHLIATILKDKQHYIGLELIEQNTVLGKEIKLLLKTSQLIKKDLFTLVEGENR